MRLNKPRGIVMLSRAIEPANVASDRIRHLAWWGQAMCLLSMAVPAVMLTAAIFDDSMRSFFLFGGAQIDGKPPLPLSPNAQKLVVFSILPVLLCHIFALWSGFQLFSGYRRGEIFTQRAASYLSRIGWALFASAPLSFFVHATLSKLVSEPSQTGGAAISMPLSISDVDFSSIAFGLIAIIIGRVLGEAAKLSEENRLFV
jgi:Protein of unknown function (DUF2975)